MTVFSEHPLTDVVEPHRLLPGQWLVWSFGWVYHLTYAHNNAISYSFRCEFHHIPAL